MSFAKVAAILPRPQYVKTAASGRPFPNMVSDWLADLLAAIIIVYCYNQKPWYEITV